MAQVNGLLDLVQSASNTAADTVAGPVDLISWALRKAGVPVPEDAVGGSEWMKKKGLKKDVQQSPASLAGETFGLISPIVAAAKAPQIAAGLIKAGENAAAPRTLNPQKGAIVWHGSPHKFDRFDASKIGTGEGAQAYGHGLYVAEAPDVARTYATDRAYVGKAMQGQPTQTNFDAPWIAQQAIDVHGDNAAKHLEMVLRSNGSSKNPQQLAYNKEVADALEMVRGGKVAPQGNLYKVDLPDPLIARMLDWDKPLSQQAPGAVRRMEKALASDTAGLSNAQFFEAKDWLNDYVRLQNLTPSQLPFVEGFNSRRITDALREAGIPGIRYLDNQSRGNGSIFKKFATEAEAADFARQAGGTSVVQPRPGGFVVVGEPAKTSNFVIFPGEENALRILERNGRGLLD